MGFDARGRSIQRTASNHDNARDPARSAPSGILLVSLPCIVGIPRPPRACSVVEPLERHVEFPEMVVPSIEVLLDDGGAGPEEAARELRRAWGITEFVMAGETEVF
jgi:hypothetical protein